jgi:hypothetical protein
MLKFFPDKHSGGKVIDPTPQQKFEKPDNCILECVQNAIDAAIIKDGVRKSTKLKFQFKMIKKDDCKFLDKNFEKHLNERKYNKRTSFTSDIPCLIMEDFNTTGITGDPEILDEETTSGERNNWYYFLYDFGGKSKLDDPTKGGSEGEGMQTFMLNSGISTFFGLSVDSSNNNLASIFGMSYFGSRKVDGLRYSVFASFGKEKEIEGNKECVPESDAKKVEDFISLFGLKRNINEPGTSIVIPFYNREEIDEKFIIQKLLDIYRVPIFRKQLEIEVGDLKINHETIQKLATDDEENLPTKRLCDDYYNFLSEIKDNEASSNFYELGFYDQDDVKKQDIDKFDKLIEDFNLNKVVQLRVKFQVKKYQKNSKTRTEDSNTFYDVYFKRYPSALDNLRETYNDFIRGPMPLYKRRNKQCSMFHLVDVQDKHVALLFKHAEQANHSEISVDNWKLKEDYKGFRKIISLSRNITTKIYRLITLESTEEDFEATQDFFKINEEGFGQNDEEDLGTEEENSESDKKEENIKSKVTHIVVPPILNGLKKYEVSQSNEKDGTVTYKIRGLAYQKDQIKESIEKAQNYLEETKKIDITKYTDEIGQKQLDLMQNTISRYKKRIIEYQNFLTDGCTFYPRRVVVEAAFDSEGLSNPFRRYSVRDFDFGDESFKINMKNVKGIEKNNNQIVFFAHEPKFEFSINGFGDGIEDIRWRDRNYNI